MKKIVLLCLFHFVLIACEEEKSLKAEYTAIMNYVIEVHYEVMPEMSELNTLITKLQVKIEAEENTGNYKKAQADLKAAHHFMMEWMTDFSEKFPNALEEPTFSDDKLKKKLELLKEEEKEVQEMKTSVITSIANAKKLLETEN